jgi:alpha-galactosidase/6-phospho-beta-glucosidase family protein
MNRPKITFIGAGSSKFIREVVVDLFTYPALEDSHIELMDVDAVALHDLAVTGTFQKDRRLIYQAVQADPLTTAILTLPRIHEMVDEMFVANREYLSAWK